jgi:hypothetical protein
MGAAYWHVNFSVSSILPENIQFWKHMLTRKGPGDRPVRATVFWSLAGAGVPDDRCSAVAREHCLSEGFAPRLTGGDNLFDTPCGPSPPGRIGPCEILAPFVPVDDEEPRNQVPGHEL